MVIHQNTYRHATPYKVTKEEIKERIKKGYANIVMKSGILRSSIYAKILLMNEPIENPEEEDNLNEGEMQENTCEVEGI